MLNPLPSAVFFLPFFHFPVILVEGGKQLEGGVNKKTNSNSCYLIKMP
jgi:hypothetical protein